MKEIIIKSREEVAERGESTLQMHFGPSPDREIDIMRRNREELLG